MHKREDLSSVVDSSTADIVVLTETWLSSKIRNSEILDCQKRFNIYRHDREERNGGGVMIAVADNVQSFHVNIVSDLELVWVGIHLKNKTYILGACYRPPSANATFISKLHDAINAVTIRFPNAPIMLLGDFNYPSIDWYNVRTSVSHLSSE